MIRGTSMDRRTTSAELAERAGMSRGQVQRIDPGVWAAQSAMPSNAQQFFTPACSVSATAAAFSASRKSPRPSVSGCVLPMCRADGRPVPLSFPQPRRPSRSSSNAKGRPIHSPRSDLVSRLTTIHNFTAPHPARSPRLFRQSRCGDPGDECFAFLRRKAGGSTSRSECRR